MLTSASAASADALVVRAIGPSARYYRPGSVLPNTRTIVLRSTDVVILLDERGTRTLRGPGAFPVRASASTPVRRQTQTAMLWNQQRRARIGAVRSVNGEADSRPNLWMVDTASAGTACIVDPGAVTLWRADAKAAGVTMITGPDGANASVSWNPGEASQPWPTALPVVSGGAYRLSGMGAGAGGTSVTLKLLNPMPATVQDTGKALIAAGCQVQLDLLMAQVGEAE